MLFERNDPLVCDAFRRGEFDYIDAAGEISETEGLFIGDGTYLFVPDNDSYEGSARLLFGVDQTDQLITAAPLAALATF